MLVLAICIFSIGVLLSGIFFFSWRGKSRLFMSLNIAACCGYILCIGLVLQMGEELNNLSEQVCHYLDDNCAGYTSDNTEEAEETEIVFVIDTSGSMSAYLDEVARTMSEDLLLNMAMRDCVERCMKHYTLRGTNP